MNRATPKKSKQLESYLNLCVNKIHNHTKSCNSFRPFFYLLILLVVVFSFFVYGVDIDFMSSFLLFTLRGIRSWYNTRKQTGTTTKKTF